MFADPANIGGGTKEIIPAEEIRGYGEEDHHGASK